MKNIDIHLDGDKLTIVIDLSREYGLSSSGKSITIATTEGNISIPGREDIKLGLNTYKPRSRTTLG